MSISLVLLVTMAVLYAAGVYLLLERSMTRVLFGFLLLGNATNLLIFIMVGEPGKAPIADNAGEETDPLPQALILTAIVITFAVSAFLLALIYRSWRLSNVDTVADDEADVALREGTAGSAVDQTELSPTDEAGETEFSDDSDDETVEAEAPR